MKAAPAMVYGGAGDLVSSLWGSLHPSWPAGPPPLTFRIQVLLGKDPGGAGKAALSHRKGRITRRPGQGPVTRGPAWPLPPLSSPVS